MNDLTNEERMKAEGRVKKDHEAHVRWQGVTITQLGHVVNLLITFSVATLGYVVNLALTGQIKVGLELRFACYTLLAAIAAGIITNFSRLRDFRHSARAARCRELKGRRDLGEDLSQEHKATILKYEGSHGRAKCYGCVSWWAFGIQLATFLVSYSILTHALLTLPPDGPKSSGEDCGVIVVDHKR